MRLFLDLLLVLCASHVLTEEIPESKLELADTKNHANGTDREEFLVTLDKTRDKRALGLILTGLAQVFGYTVNPIRIASLPNEELDPQAGRAGSASTNSTNAPQPVQNQPATSPAPASNQTTAPRQRETIRFTGVVNFGNSSNLVNHLQQYERLFHGESTTESSSAPNAASSTTSAPMIDPRTVNATRPPLLAPLLVKIPLPIVPNLPPPINPTGDLKLSYPSVSNKQETVYRKNEKTEKLTIEQKDLYNEDDVQSPPSTYVHSPPSAYVQTVNVAEPHWKQLYEDRLAELERKQEEHAEKLRQQELHNKRPKEEDYTSKEAEEKYRQPERVVVRVEEASGYRGKDNEKYNNDYSREEEGEGYVYEEKTPRPSSGQYADGSEEREDEGSSEAYKLYENEKDSPLKTFNNHTAIRFNEQLPISDYYEKRKPEELRNSYGEILDSRELIDEGITDYLGNLKQSNQYYLPVETPKNAEDEEEEDGGESLGKQNKYEEYELEAERDVDRSDGKNAKTAENGGTLDIFKNTYKVPFDGGNFGTDKSKYSNRVQSRPQSSEEESKENDSFDSRGYLPYVVPVRHLYARDELKKAKAMALMRAGDRREDARKLPPKKINEEDLTPKIGPPFQPKRLHEGENKQSQFPLSPFDFVFDSTEQTNFVSLDPPSHANAKDLTPCQESERSAYARDKFFTRLEKPDTAESPPSGQEIYYDQDVRGSAESKAESRLSISPDSYTKGNVQFEPQRIEKIPDVVPRQNYYNKNYQPPVTKVPNHNPVRRTEEHKLRPATNEYNPRYQISAPIYVPPYTRRSRSAKKQEQPQTRRKSKETESVQNARAQRRPKTFSDPQSAHDFFGFSRDDYSFDDEKEQPEQITSDERQAKEKPGEEVIGLVAPDPVPDQDEDTTKLTDPDDTEDGNVRIIEYANKVATVKVSEQKRTSPGGPVTYIRYTRNL